MTPTEARALADRAEKYGHSPIGLRKPPQAYALLDSAKALRSLADQVEALQGQALSSVEREEYFAMKADAERYRWLMADDGNASITGRFNSAYRAWNGEDGADGFTAAIDRAREAT